MHRYKFGPYAFALLLLVVFTALGCNVGDNAGDSNSAVEGGGSSQPDAGGSPGDGTSNTGDESSLSDIIITPLLSDAPTRPPAIITPPMSPDTAPTTPPVVIPVTCGNDVLDDGEPCDTSLEPCCAIDCSGFAAAGTVCREAAGACDAAEACTGDSGACPDDDVASRTVVCREASDDCDVADHCDGTSIDCPADRVARNTVVCRAKQGVCDVIEHCDGTAKACPTDRFLTAIVDAAPCRAAAQGALCDVAEYCNGSGPDCPADGFNQGSVCRLAVAGGCDVAETCPGDSAQCPADDGAPDGSACNGALGKCSLSRCCPGATTVAAAAGLCSLASGDEVVFVTSSDTDGAVGLGSADKICNDLASSANLAGGFHAWLSTTTITRVSGNARNRVGQGPYALVDGTSIADGIAELTQGGMKDGIGKTEWGVARPTSVWTGTNAGGTIMRNVDNTPFACSDWGTTSGSGETGSSVTNKPNWTADATQSCATPLALYCFADDPISDTGLVFVTSSNAYLGDGLDSLAAGDDHCNSVASNAGLKGTYVAWMSDDKTDARDRIPDRAYVMTDDTTIASSLADLTDGTIGHAIDVDESGNTLPRPIDSFPIVWTGTDASGKAAHHCSGWFAEDAVEDATYGNWTSSTSSWTESTALEVCIGQALLYCFQID